jgi:hypothetical protein
VIDTTKTGTDEPEKPLANETYLSGLDSAVRITPAFRLGTETADFDDYVRGVPGLRKHPLQPVRDLLDECMRRFQQGDTASDEWLGPRLHLALRMSRREAGNRDVWRFLGVWGADYVRWRFGPEKGETDLALAAKEERFVGPQYKHALARLWWMTELFRNGKDYTTAALALTNQDVINTLFRMDIAHHRPAAVAAVQVLPRNNDGTKLVDGRLANALAKATNSAASTLMLDALAPDEPLDISSRHTWEKEANDYDPRNYFDSLSEGPDDPEIPANSLKAMGDLMRELLEFAPVRGKASKQMATDGGDPSAAASGDD